MLSLFKVSLRSLLVCLFIFTIGSQLSAKNQSFLENSKAFVGLGPVFTNLPVGYAQFGGDTLIKNINKFEISAGPMVGLGFARGYFSADLDGYLKVLYDAKINDDYSIGLYARLPVGLTLAKLGTFFALGFNVGLVPGAEFFFNRHWGIYAELGFFHHSLFPVKHGLGFHAPAGTFSFGASYKF
jgi:hypothetical protein